MTGDKAKGNIFLASTDRVAIDAVGVAILKSLGSNPAIMGPRVFEQEQIARAAQLGLGVSSPSGIDLISGDRESEDTRKQIARILAEG